MYCALFKWKCDFFYIIIWSIRIKVVRVSHQVTIPILYYWFDFYIAFYISWFDFPLPRSCKQCDQKIWSSWNSNVCIEWEIEMIEVKKVEYVKRKLINDIFQDKSAPYEDFRHAWCSFCFLISQTHKAYLFITFCTKKILIWYGLKTVELFHFSIFYFQTY